jgi:hypothetical protein
MNIIDLRKAKFERASYTELTNVSSREHDIESLVPIN